MKKVTLLSLFSGREKEGDGNRIGSAFPPKRLDAQKVQQILTAAETMVYKWDADTSAYAGITSLWYESRAEARKYLGCVSDLQSAMRFLSATDPSSPHLVKAQNLMVLAMKRLQKEFYQILAANRCHLDPESLSGRSSTSTSEFDEDNDSEDEIRKVGKSIVDVESASSLAMADLRSIAESMIAFGYGKECVKVYKILRKSIVDEGIYRLGIERMSSAQIQKMDWDVLEMKIRVWIHAVKVAVRTLFSGERFLCDHVFSASHSIGETCFADITGEAARLLFAFPESVAKGKYSPEKIFRILDLYDAIAELWPEIESTFSYEASGFVRAQAMSALIKLGDAIRSMMADFEAAILKDSSKAPVPGSGLHPMTRYVMNFLSVLADYRQIIADITADCPVKNPLPNAISECLNSEPIATRFAWLVLSLLCKIDGRSELYGDVSFSYLFLANNLHYIIQKVQSSELRVVLGDSWVTMHAEKLRQYSANYERTAWKKVTTALAEIPADANRDSVRQAFRRFNLAFEEAYRAQTAAVVVDSSLREELKSSIAQKIVPAYRSFYGRFRAFMRREVDGEPAVKFSPEDIENCLSGLFYGSGTGSAPPSVHLRASSR
ncbi:exocyst complex component EXO70H1-like [Nymphaea colorata]|uniref:Exocyst subunit Exo70 family protein n=1 Tax=Nymphaea colorata TaxID=210225 RepID=A0A5K1DVV7_9MAGN|nr:exocyst complex component EXO70H1-like [Nymphaea colorata]